MPALFKNMENNETYKIKFVDGNPVIECRSEEIIKPDGSRSVVIHAPSLSVVQNFLSGLKGTEEVKNG